MHREQHERDTLVLLRSIRPHEAEAPVGPLRPTRPDLLAIDDEMVTLIFGLGLKTCQVAARARLREALAPGDLAAADRRDVLLLLRLGAVFQQRRAEHHHAHAADRVVGAGAGELALHYARLGAGQAPAAVGRGPGGRAPALRAHRLAPGFLVGRGVAAALLPRHRVGLALERGGEIRLHPRSDLLAEGLQIRAA